MSDHRAMETLQQALDRLLAEGYDESLRATPEGFESGRSGVVCPPESLVVKEIVRFEGASDPDDEAVLFAVASRDDSLRGTFVTAFGPGADPVAAELVRRLDDRERASAAGPPT